jgi:diguanylate cyclase (GGDEF)-like protein
LTEILDHKMALRLLEDLPVGVFVADEAGAVRWANPACRAMISLAPDASPAGVDLPRLPGQSAEYTVPDPSDGHPRHLRCRRLPDLEGAAAFVIEDVSGQHALQDTVEHLEASVATAGRHDALTGLPNRRALIELLEAQIARSRRYHNPLAVIRLELQDLEVRPERREAVLVAVAHLLNDQLRWSDIRGYWNEASFLMVLPETSGSAAAQLAEKLIEQLAALQDTFGVLLAVKASAAVTAWTHGDDLQRMMARVNVLMAQAARGKPPVAIG